MKASIIFYVLSLATFGSSTPLAEDEQSAQLVTSRDVQAALYVKTTGTAVSAVSMSVAAISQSDPAAVMRDTVLVEWADASPTVGRHRDREERHEGHFKSYTGIVSIELFNKAMGYR
ncbi:hypothetical protein SVAN01_09306 [Stagonosporopsis vannaccii]|nr:hypothetical protein SVAN01_09306 [Stagonosporopsis vannaccii]